MHHFEALVTKAKDLPKAAPLAIALQQLWVENNSTVITRIGRLILRAALEHYDGLKLSICVPQFFVQQDGMIMLLWEFEYRTFYIKVPTDPREPIYIHDSGWANDGDYGGGWHECKSVYDEEAFERFSKIFIRGGNFYMGT